MRAHPLDGPGAKLLMVISTSRCKVSGCEAAWRYQYRNEVTPDTNVLATRAYGIWPVVFLVDFSNL